MSAHLSREINIQISADHAIHKAALVDKCSSVIYYSSRAYCNQCMQVELRTALQRALKRKQANVQHFHIHFRNSCFCQNIFQRATIQLRGRTSYAQLVPTFVFSKNFKRSFGAKLLSSKNTILYSYF